MLPVACYLAAYASFIVAVPLLTVIGLSGMDDGATSVALAGFLALAIILAFAYLQYRLAGAVFLRLARARPIASGEEPVLRSTMEAVCVGAGVRPPRLYVVESKSPNAFATGLSPDRASLVVTRGLLSLLDKTELEGVIAHEVSHIANQDTRLNTVMAAAIALLLVPIRIVVGFFRLLFHIHWVVGVGAVLYLLLSLRFAVSLSDILSEDRAVALWMLFSMGLSAYCLVGGPLLALVIRRSVSREREFLADSEAALLTRFPEGLARALAKIEGASGHGINAPIAMGHLYLVEALPTGAPWWDRIFSTHPPIEERVRRLAEMGGVAPAVLEEAQAAGVNAAAAAPEEPVGGSPEAEDDLREDGDRENDARMLRGFFRLTEGATLYTTPEIGSSPMGELPAGALVDVLEAREDFLRVLTPQDTFGYIARSTPMKLEEAIPKRSQ